jgi:hypothetical protein
MGMTTPTTMTMTTTTSRTTTTPTARPFWAEAKPSPMTQLKIPKNSAGNVILLNESIFFYLIKKRTNLTKIFISYFFVRFRLQ